MAWLLSLVASAPSCEFLAIVTLLSQLTDVNQTSPAHTGSISLLSLSSFLPLLRGLSIVSMRVSLFASLSSPHTQDHKAILEAAKHLHEQLKLDKMTKEKLKRKTQVSDKYQLDQTKVASFNVTPQTENLIDMAHCLFQ